MFKLLKNKEIYGVLIGLLISVTSIITSILPVVFSLDMMQWGYGIICISGFVFILGLVTFLMYLYRFIKLEQIFSGENVLIHWQYPQEDYFEQAKKNLSETKKTNKFLFGIMLFFFVLFTSMFSCFGFSTGDVDLMFMFAGFMFSILLLISLFAFGMPYVFYWQALKANSEVIISKSGIYYMGQLHTWNPPLFLLRNVEISKNEKELNFTISYFTKLGWLKYEDYFLNVKIPEGKIDEAKKLVDELNNQ